MGKLGTLWSKLFLSRKQRYALRRWLRLARVLDRASKEMRRGDVDEALKTFILGVKDDSDPFVQLLRLCAIQRLYTLRVQEASPLPNVLPFPRQGEAR